MPRKARSIARKRPNTITVSEEAWVEFARRVKAVHGNCERFQQLALDVDLPLDPGRDWLLWRSKDGREWALSRHQYARTIE